MDKIEKIIEKLEKGIKNPFVSQAMKDKMVVEVEKLRLQQVNVSVPAKKLDPTIGELKSRLKLLTLMAKKDPKVKTRLKILEMMIKKIEKSTKSSSKAPSSGKIKMKNIVIEYAEGDTSKYDKFPKTYTSWKAANEALMPVSKNIGERGGYNKVGFIVNFEDDSEYTGSLGITMGVNDNPFDTNNVIGEHIKTYLNYQLSGVHDIGDETRDEMTKWLKSYDLGVKEPKRVNKVSAKELVDKMVKWVKDNGVDPDYAHKIKFITEKDVEEFMSYGVYDDLIMMFYCGVNIALEWKVDGEVEGVKGIFPIMDDYVVENINEALKYCKGNKFEIGLKYSNFDWSKILKGKPTEKIISGITKDSAIYGGKRTHEFKILIYPNIVVGRGIGDVIEKDDSIMAESTVDRSLKVFEASYLGLVSSDPKVILDTLKAMAKQSESYVKDVEVLVNGLGGVGYQALDKNAIKYEDGGEVDDTNIGKKVRLIEDNLPYTLTEQNKKMWLDKDITITSVMPNGLYRGTVDETQETIPMQLFPTDWEEVLEDEHSFKYEDGGELLSEIGFQEMDYKKLIGDAPDYPYYSTQLEDYHIILDENTEEEVAEWHPDKAVLIIKTDANGFDKLESWLTENSYNTKYEDGGEIKTVVFQVKKPNGNWEDRKEWQSNYPYDSELSTIEREYKQDLPFYETRITKKASKGGSTYNDGGSVSENKTWNVMVRKTPNSYWEQVNKDTMTIGEADELRSQYAKSGIEYHELENHIDIGFQRGGSVDGEPKSLKGYRVDFFRSSKISDLPSNIVSGGQFRSMILVTDGKHGDSFTVMSNEPYLKLQTKEFMGNKHTSVVPVNIDDGAWKMFGGVFVWSSDSRFRDDVSEKPLPLHDRVEKRAKGGQADETWMQDAEEEMEREGTVGLFTKKAEQHKMTTVEFAKEVLKKKNKDEFDLKTRRQAQFMKNANPELFEDGGSVEEDYSHSYMMLDRMRSDCDYFLGNGNGNEKRLHQGSVEAQIAEMKKLWNSFPKDAKPEWLSMSDILEYETKMKNFNHELFSDGGEVIDGYDLGYARLGNGTSVYNRAKEVSGDYESIAHISEEGHIKFRKDNLPESVKEKVNNFWKNYDKGRTVNHKGYEAIRNSISQTQGTVTIYKDGKEMWTISETITPDYSRKNPYKKNDEEIKEVIDFYIKWAEDAELVSKKSKGEYTVKELTSIYYPEFSSIKNKYEVK